MKFWRFHQNNSGGSFHIDDKAGIGPNVWIEAENEDAANNKALSIGIYFNGIEGGSDCECCGDRWYSVVSGDDFEGLVKIDREYDFNWHDTVYVHRADGSIERIKEDFHQ